jgi:hypothetical protein
MTKNKYIKRLIRKYDNLHTQKLAEILSSKPKNWDECKEYFKAWIEKLFLSPTTRLFVEHNMRKGTSILIYNMMQYIKESLEDEILP